MNSYIMVIFADILLAANFAIQKKYQRDNGTAAYQGLFFNAAAGLFSAILFLLIAGFKPEFSWYSLIMSATKNMLGVLYTLIGFRIMREGGMSLYTLFLMSGGMIVPYIWGILFLDESVSILRIAGCLLITISIVVSNFQKGQHNKRMLLLCAAVFFINGFVSVTSKVHQVNTMYETVSTNDFIFWGAGIKAILCSLALFGKKKEGNIKSLGKPKTVLLILLSSIIGGASSFLLLYGALSIPATVLYPLNTGGTIILSALAGVLCYKEKLSQKQIVSIVVCFIGTCAFL